MLVLLEIGQTFLLEQIIGKEFLTPVVSKIYEIRYVHLYIQRIYEEKRQSILLNCILPHTSNTLPS